MDPGISTDTTLSFDERVEANLLPKDTSLSLSQLISVMDQMLTCEVCDCSFDHI